MFTNAYGQVMKSPPNYGQVVITNAFDQKPRQNQEQHESGQRARIYSRCSNHTLKQPRQRKTKSSFTLNVIALQYFDPFRSCGKRTTEK